MIRKLLEFTKKKLFKNKEVENENDDWKLKNWNYEIITNKYGVSYKFAILDKNASKIEILIYNSWKQAHLEGKLFIEQGNELQYLLPRDLVFDINHGESAKKRQDAYIRICIIEKSPDKIAVEYERKKFKERHNIDYDVFKIAALQMSKEDIAEIDDLLLRHIIRSISYIEEMKNYKTSNINFKFMDLNNEFFKEDIQLTKEDEADIEFLGKSKALEMKKQKLIR